MANLESEIKDLKEKNNDLVQKVQYWKMTAAQRENEKLSLMKEINELRLKLSKLRSTGGLQAQNLDTAIQAASEKALAHLVRASGEIAHTIDLAKAYMRDRQELEASSPRWSAISGTPSTDKAERIHRVPPTIMGGQSIQPVVALSRTLLNTSNPRLTSRSPNQNRNVSERAVPMHMLQDVYIPLTRIDADRVLNNMETESRPHSADNSAEDLEDSTERVLDESQNMSEDEDFNATRRLDAVTEDLEPEEEMESPTHRGRPDPLEGPSWLLDGPIDKKRRTTRLPNLEPDSTTGAEGSAPPPEQLRGEKEETVGRLSCVFSPTVRRRKQAAPPRAPTPPHARTPPRALSPRALSPPHAPTQQLRYSPKPLSARKNSSSGRVLKLLVAKMRLSGDGSRAPAAPSPSGATHAALVCPLNESGSQHSRRGEEEGAGDMSETSLTSGPHTRRSDDSDSDSVVGSRSRRNRKVVTYKEKPLNRKLRR
ncbi:uncharacterized protein LOC114239458 [Bombyx mandarina]|uniref:Uncharacterized protein LOC114239458 n=1 Tax=Bombyx mandarina TaxID=7092 RepID=A0A6J2J7S8_BOMMA|nr:uncharacterized protein LOC114239458 [Bombyx mandarina]